MRFLKVVVFVAVLAGVFAAAAAALRFTDASFFTPTGIVGTPYSHTFQGEGSCGPALPHQFRVVNGNFPPGLTLSSSGAASGIPATPGEWKFWVELSDENPPSQGWCVPKRAEREFTIIILPALTIQQNAAPVGTVGQAYDLQLTAAGGGSHTWSLQSGTPPPGVTFDPASHRVTGTPTAAGDFQFVVRVTDGSRVDTETLSMSVREPLVIAEPEFTPSEVGVAFTGQIQVTGGLNVAALRSPLRARTQTANRAAYTLTVAGLPSGLVADAAGAITGTPTSAGSFPVTINASDPEGRTARLVAPLVVAPKLAIITKRLRDAKAGKLYRVTVKTRGGVTPFKWGKLTGKLPVGIRFDRKTGVLSGTAKKAGTYTITVSLSDALKVASQQVLTFKLIGAPKPKPKAQN